MWQCCFCRQCRRSLATGVLAGSHCSQRVERCAEVTRKGDPSPTRPGDKYSACVCVVMDPHHVNHHTPTEAASGGGTSANNSQTSQGSNSAPPVVIPGPSSSSSSSAPPPPVVVGAAQPPLTSPVPAAKIVSRNVNGTRELQVSGSVDRCQCY